MQFIIIIIIIIIKISSTASDIKLNIKSLALQLRRALTKAVATRE